MGQRISAKTIAALTKKAEALEAQMWAKVPYEKFPFEDQIVAFYDRVWPFREYVWHRWLSGDSAIRRLVDRRGQIEKSHLPIHPAFLPYESEAVRRLQWALYHSQQYREVLTKLHSRYVSELIPRYDVNTKGMLQIALDLFREEIDEQMADYEYMKVQASREAFAASEIEFHRIFRRMYEAEPRSYDRKKLEELYNRAGIEYLSRNRGYRVTEAEFLAFMELCGRVRKDRRSGKPASESEAVRESRELHERYPGRAIDFSLYEPGKRLSRY